MLKIQIHISRVCLAPKTEIGQNIYQYISSLHDCLFFSVYAECIKRQLLKIIRQKYVNLLCFLVVPLSPSYKKKKKSINTYLEEL